ncbi:MAG: universal stress protein [Haloferacaceae archaeon]|jgi:nucleotide-binding universal stress UspA family protein
MYDVILLPTDGSPAAMDAAAHAWDLAAQYDATVHVLSVVEMADSPSSGDESGETLTQRKADAQAAVTDVIDAAPDGVDCTGAVEVGTPSQQILQYARETAADLIVMSTHARSGIGRFLYGSITEQVIRDGDVPVLAVQRERA